MLVQEPSAIIAPWHKDRDLRARKAGDFSTTDERGLANDGGSKERPHKYGHRNRHYNPVSSHCICLLATHRNPCAIRYFFRPLVSRPFWCSTRLVTSPFSFFTNSICASTSFRKNMVADSAN